MSAFTLPEPEWTPRVTVTLPGDLTKDELMRFIPFKNWLETLQKSIREQNKRSHVFHAREERYSLRSIKIQSVDRFGSRIGFIKFEADVRNSKDERPLPGVVFLRGGSVALLVILRAEGDDTNERWVVMTKQPRIPAGSLDFFEIPAGMIDDEGNFAGAAARELYEETGLKAPTYELQDMTAMALARAVAPEAHLQKAMYPSPGGCDEFISLFLWQRTMPLIEINRLKDRLVSTDDEKITVKLVNYEELWKEGARDAKTLAAWALYEGLTRVGALDK